MNEADFDRRVHQNWADAFGCPLDTTQRAGTTLIPRAKYSGKRIIALWQIGRHAFVEFDPAYGDLLARVTAGLADGISVSGDDLEQALGSEAIHSRDKGLALYLYPPDLPDYRPFEPFRLCRLTPVDEDAMQSLHEACTPEDVDEGLVEVDHEIVFGCFLGNRLAAAASGYERNGFLDIGVLTHPGFRRKGLGKAVVGALCEWSAGKDMIAQYRCNVQNIGSQKTANALKFRLQFNTEDISLRI